MSGVDPTFTIDDEVNRQPEYSAVTLGEFIVAHGDRIVQLVLLIEVAHRLGIIVHRDSNDLEAIGAVLVLHLHEVRNLGTAGPAPGGPEIEQHDLALVVGEAQLAAFKIGEREFGRSACGAGRSSLGSPPPVEIVTTRKTREHDEQYSEAFAVHDYLSARLLALGDGITLVHPVGAEVIGDVNGLYVGESERLQYLVCRVHVRAVSPGAASAVDDDGGIPGSDFTLSRSFCCPASLEPAPMYSEPGMCA